MSAAKSIAYTLATFLALLLVSDGVVRSAFPHFARLSDNFSVMYLAREIQFVAADRRAIIVLGDSALWGYKLPPTSTAVSILRSDGCDCRNLSFEGGSPVNTYAMLRLLVQAGATPRALIFNVNQKEFNPADSAYQTLHPAVLALARPLLSRRDLANITVHDAANWNASVDAVIARSWALYGLRYDLREALFGDVDAVHALQSVIESRTGALSREADAHVPTADRFEGTYDLTPLAAEKDNVSVAFMREIGALTRARRLPAIAILTPTNHRLLHDYIDSPVYDQNLAYTRRLLESYGVRVLDLDRAIPSDEFIDNDHLTAAGNRRLANLLQPVVAQR
jgi:lysophospholipase L1-like esterase